jgi:hypothetical protein
MSLWGSLTSNNKPIYYGNTADVYAVNVATEQANTQIPHAGWVVERPNYSGVTLVVANAGAGYLVGDTLTFTGGTTHANTKAAGTVATVNGSGGILTLNVTNAGQYTTNVAPTVGVTSANGSAAGAVITATVNPNGRLGRTFVEVLVAGSFDDTTYGVG